MKPIHEKKIIHWISNSLDITTDFNFISTQELYKDYCASYNIEYNEKKLISFSILLTNVFKKLKWDVKKHRTYDKRGYKNLVFKNTKKEDVFSLLTYEKKINELHKIDNILYFQAIDELNKKILDNTEILKEFIKKEKK